VTQAFGYCRVSSVGQAGDERGGIDRQKEAITKYAKEHGMHIVQWFCDSITGTSDLDNRPALRDLVTALTSNGVVTVIVEKVDRLARDLMVQESIIKDFKRKKFEIVSTCEPDLCSADPTRILIRQILGAFAQYEKSMIVAKLRGGRQRAKAKDASRHEGRKKYGTKPGEQEIIGRIFQLRGNGLAVREIIETLHKEGLRPRGTKKNKGVWQPTVIVRILKRPNIA